MVAVEGGNVLHHVKREGELSLWYIGMVGVGLRSDDDK